MYLKNKDRFINFRLPVSTYDRLLKICDIRDCSISSLIREIIEEYLRRYGG